LKKTFAILLLCIHLFNICGIQLFFSFAEKAADKQMVAVLDNNKYNEADLIQIKFPLNMPYTVDHKTYERCDGNIVVNGVQYNYVKRSISNDTLYLYCVPNQQKTALSNSKTEYAKQSSDIPSSKKSEQPTAKQGNVLSEYNTSIHQYSFPALINSENTFSVFKNGNTSIGFLIKPAQPPELFS